jgi:quercetin dioxygenase-like cupin family protein
MDGGGHGDPCCRRVVGVHITTPELGSPKDSKMRHRPFAACAFAASIVGAVADAQEHGLARPNLVLKEVVEAMPKGDQQEIKALTATFKPGDKTVFHTHRFPVTVYILEAAFTLELEGRPPVTVRAGESMIEPPTVRMTGFNKSATERLKVVIFYVSDPDTPFLDLAQ